VPEASQVALGAGSSSTPACRGTNLVGAFAYSNLYAGGGIITIAISNIGTSSCLLGGYPRLSGVRDGRAYALRIVGRGTQDGSLNPSVLAPRMSGALILDTSLGCSANVASNLVADSYSAVILLLPHKEGRVKVPGVPLYVPCGLAVSQLGWAKGFVFN
jgi:hypothetical protein